MWQPRLDPRVLVTKVTKHVATTGTAVGLVALVMRTSVVRVSRVGGIPHVQGRVCVPGHSYCPQWVTVEKTRVKVKVSLTLLIVVVRVDDRGFGVGGALFDRADVLIGERQSVGVHT